MNPTLEKRKTAKRLLAATFTRGAADGCVMGVLFATFRRQVFRAEFRALRSFARRRPAGVAVADLFWHGGMSASCRTLPISDLHAVVGRAGASAAV
jgi:hypothetical protein